MSLFCLEETTGKIWIKVMHADMALRL